MTKRSYLPVSVCAALLFAGVALAQTSEATGEVTDLDGNPMKGVVVKFHPRSNDRNVYKGKTNKKGKYFIPGLFTAQEEDTWIVEIELEGYGMKSATVETRTVNRVLLMGPKKSNAVGGKVSGFQIPKLGKAMVDIVVATREQLAQGAVAAPAATGDAGVAVADSAATPPPQKEDPWARALTLAGEGELEGSLPEFEKAIEAEPESLERVETYANVLAQLERFDDALVAAGQAEALDPVRVKPYVLQTRILARLGRYEEADAVVTRGLAQLPTSYELLQQRSVIAAATGDPEAQIAAYRAMTEVRADDPAPWIALGNLYHDSGRAAESEAAFRKVVEIDPDNAYQTYYNLAIAKLQKSDASDAERRQAIDALRRAVEIKPDYANAWKQMGLALIGTGDRAGAREALERYVSISPSASDAAQMKAIIGTLSK